MGTNGSGGDERAESAGGENHTDGVDILIIV